MRLRLVVILILGLPFIKPAMPRFRFPRRWAILLLLYIAADFMDPSIPGAFFFDSGVLFVDGVVQVKSNVSMSVATPEPMPFGGRPVDSDERNFAATTLRARSPRPRRPRMAWNSCKHDDSKSLASSSPSEPLPTPNLS